MSKLLRLLGALFAVAIIATACGNSATTETAADAGEPAADETSGEDAMSEHGDDDHADEHSADDPDDQHEASDDEHGDQDRDHAHSDTLDITDGDPVPALTMTVTETDTPGEYTLAVGLTNFTVTPDNVDGDPIANEGHMHYLLNGTKVDRFYDLERTIELEPGEQLVEVELNANNHLPWSVDGERIHASQLVVVPGEAAGADVTIDVTYEGGEVTLAGDDRISVPVGSSVRVHVVSDVDEEVHLHGYDVLVAVSPDTPGVLEFTADTAGRYELEFETSGVFIAELAVS